MKSRLTCGSCDLLSAVQYSAWIDLLMVLVLLIPLILVFKAANGLTPVVRENTIIHHQNGNKSEEIIQVQYIYYRANRNMTHIEYKIMQRVREGCGRNYVRDFPSIWKRGRDDLTVASFCFNGALLITLISSTLFLLTVPSRGSFFGKNMPLFHLVLQIVSVTMNLVGSWQINDVNLCFLEYVWPKLRIQTGFAVFYTIYCLVYKCYEILLIDAYVRSHLVILKEAAALSTTPSQEILTLMGQLKTKREAILEDAKEVSPSTVNWGEADSDIKSILEGLKSRVDNNETPSEESIQTQQQQQSNTSLNFFNSSSHFNFAPITQTMAISLPKPVSINVNNTLSRKQPEQQHDILKDDMKIIFPKFKDNKF